MGANNVRDKKALINNNEFSSSGGVSSDLCLDLSKERKQIVPEEPVPMFTETFSISPPVCKEMIEKNKPQTIATFFEWSGDAKSAYIAGTFNNWRAKIPMVKSHGNFSAIVELPEGVHEYKFYIDDKWVCDPHKDVKSNDFGSDNNVVEVKASDFEVFEALAVDSLSPGQSSVSGSPPGVYSQNVPHPQLEKVGQHRGGPPNLPPHLKNFLLNQEISNHCEPNLLPEPNHVMLNHLFALSITDGVMVLSATNRYRKKYVTTLLYKPIDS